MKILIITCYILLSFSTNYLNDKKSVLTIIINGLENNKGKVMIALCNSEESFSGANNAAFKGANAKINGLKVVHIFDELPHGFYAIKVFHDINDNNELDVNFMGIPKEPYGFSNNARGRFGPPSWEDSRFEIKEDSLTVTIAVE
jgi:uncharacterized protein (DUF2141 family)